MISENKTFTIEVTMRERWIPHFLGMLQSMERLGKLGGSRWVRFFADGDGDYRPKFTWEKTLPTPSPPLKQIDPNGNWYDFDAG